LIVQIQRIDNDSSEKSVNNSAVDVPMELNDPFVEISPTLDRLQYKLVAATLWIGSINGGHYRACIPRESLSDLYIFDDSRCYNSQTTVFEKECSVLVFRKINGSR
jgi:ubiquitin C-terminal hydrolase